MRMLLVVVAALLAGTAVREIAVTFLDRSSFACRCIPGAEFASVGSHPACVAVASGQISCRFAPRFSASDLLKNEKARNLFLSNVVYNEGQFHSPGASATNVCSERLCGPR